MRFKCPQCNTVFNFGQPQPGKYVATCKSCKQKFRVAVYGGDRPRVRIQEQASDVALPNQSPAPIKRKRAKSTAEKQQESKVSGVNSVESIATRRIHGTADGLNSVDRPHFLSSKKQPTRATTAKQSNGRLDAHGGSGAEVSDPTQECLTNSASIPLVIQNGQSVNSVSDSNGSPYGKPPTPAKTPMPIREGSASKNIQSTAPIPEKLGGYRIVRLLGEGGMGAVYEAKQLSLDRQVALKTIRGKVTNNASALARFTREAYAAAQLNHHNVTQIYDFGEDQGQHFFSMEWVRGGTLQDLVRTKGVIDPKRAAGFVLQAARGLQFAHQHGMVHRDVKPANLLLSNEGVVKVADLGLVKTLDPKDPDTDVGNVSSNSLGRGDSRTDVTVYGSAMGTPSFMAPEQSVDATSVDHRADIYSLACTLFYLVVGRPPFEGKLISELRVQHASAEIPSLTKINSRIPGSIETIVRCGMAKRPEDRFASLAEMIRELEGFLGIQSEGQYSPSVDEAERWTGLAQSYASAGPLLQRRPMFLTALLAFGSLATVAVPLVSVWAILLGPSLVLSSILTATALGSWKGSSAVATSLRRWIASMSWLNLALYTSVSLFSLLIVVVSGLGVGLIAGTTVGVMVGSIYHFVVVARSRTAQMQCVVDAKRFVRDLRVKGADEDGLRWFAARYSGDQWQGLFEEIFGYQSMCQIRHRLRTDAATRDVRTQSDLRDWFCRLLDEQAVANKETRDRRRLAKIEERGLRSEGISNLEARQRGRQMANAVMDAAKLPPVPIGKADAARIKREKTLAMLVEARSGRYSRKRNPLTLINPILGGKARLLVGCVLLAYFGMWVHETGMVSHDQVQSLTDSFRNGGVNIKAMDSDLRSQIGELSDNQTPVSILGFQFTGWSVGVAGMLLVMSAILSGWFVTPVALIAVVVTLNGERLGVPGFNPLQPWMVSSAGGFGVLFVGIFIGNKWLARR